MKGRIAALAALAWIAAPVAANAQFSQEGPTYATGNAPYNVYAADFNADGRQDVVSSNGDANTLSVFLRQTGGFAEEAGSPFSAPGASSNGAVADFNRDGRPDLAISDFNFSNGRVVVLLRTEAGGFTPLTEIPTGGGNPASAVATGDFNQDGAVDLAIAGWGTGNVGIYLNTGTGFAPAPNPNHAVGTQPRQLAVADFNADGRLDIASVNLGSENVTVLLNTGGGEFAQEGAPTPVGNTPNGLTAGDFDRDGRPDIAVSNTDDGTVSVLSRSPIGGFTAAPGSPVAVGTGPVNLTSADFDGDGALDIAVAVSGGSVDVIRGGPAGFARSSSTPLPGSPSGIAAADFNADGRPDVAVTSLGADVLTVLLSPSPPPVQPPPPVATPTPTPVAPPVAGKSVNVEPVSGTVKLKRPGSKRYVELRQGEQIPVGTSVDTRKGRVTITAAAGKGKITKADFFDGLFKLSQSKAKVPVTTLTLTEALDCRRSGKKASAAAKKPKTRKLWGDGKGRFRTKGSYSAATVRGTRWLTQDRCDSTLTRVTKGVVAVRDEVKRKTKLVRKGHSYTAKRAR